MNFYNPYYYSLPINLTPSKTGFLGRIFGKTGVSISNFLNGTQKVLNIANQTIPLVKQLKPVIGNAKTMFKVMNEFKRVEHSTINSNNINKNIDDTSNIQAESLSNNYTDLNEGPKFFI